LFFQFRALRNRPFEKPPSLFLPLFQTLPLFLFHFVPDNNRLTPRPDSFSTLPSNSCKSTLFCVFFPTSPCLKTSLFCGDPEIHALTPFTETVLFVLLDSPFFVFWLFFLSEETFLFPLCTASNLRCSARLCIGVPFL